jgi:hypothetical protein
MVQPLASSIEFIPDKGFVLSRGGRSFLLNAASAGQRLTEKQLSVFARATSGFVDAVQGQRPLRFARDQITTGTKSLREPSDTAFVYMDEGKRRFWEQGAIRVSSLATYHRIENEMARDPREGLGLLSIFDEQAQVNLLLRRGNAAMFCAVPWRPKKALGR